MFTSQRTHEKARTERDPLQRVVLIEIATVTAGFLMVVAAVIFAVQGLSLN